MKVIILCLIVLFSLVNLSLGDCNVYISSVSNNTNNCTKETPCESFQNALKVCEDMNQTSTMTFNFDIGNYTIENSIHQMSIFNQTIMLNGSQNGTTTLSFTDPDSKVLVIYEPVGATSGSTNLNLQYLTLTNLDNSFLKSRTNMTNVDVTLLDCNFANVNAINPLFDMVSYNTQISLSILNSTFQDMTSSTNQTIIYSGSNVNLSILNSNFINSHTTSSLITSNQDYISLTNSVFNNNQIADQPMISIVNAVSVSISQGSRFSGNSLFPNGTIVPLLQISGKTFISGLFFENNTNVNGLLFSGNSTTVTSNSLIVSGNILKDYFLQLTSQSKLNIMNAQFTKNSVSSTGSFFSAIDNSTLELFDSSFVENTGYINNVIYSDATFGDNTFSDNTNFEFFYCDHSNVFYTGDYPLSALIAQSDIVCGEICIINYKPGCIQPGGTQSSSSDSTPSPKNSKSDAGKIALIIILITVGVAITAGVVYYFVKRHHKHHYTRLH
ncbi:hypothetical protein DLAC_01526 [Tieghemostelium lacteum]|uniref:Pectin lyase-like family protein n=1 Tax=Tieghemostelium lacteum TaxID=361077 RepID=A0A152A5M3_TIELA|nr:hypothetical protein DLAC_01526 [Tieghemostelium lacteum]|eukprot:KYR01533.1 hypothetical protein DLAC_01526 [Tieghemostelium lacteum]